MRLVPTTTIRSCLFGEDITMTGSGKGGMARRATTEFNDSFTTCEAHIISQ
jgi:hypothetical protein